MKLTEIVKKTLLGATLVGAMGLAACGGMRRHLDETDAGMPDGDPDAEVENHCPELPELSDSYVIEEGHRLRLGFAADDADGDDLLWVGSDLPRGAGLTPDGEFTWTPDNDQAGEYTFGVTVTDGQCADSKEVTLIVEDVNSCPVLMEMSDVAVQTGETFRTQIMGYDIDGDALEFSASRLPPGSTFDPSTQDFAWTATTAGSYDTEFSVTDGNCLDSQRVTFTATDTPIPLQVTLTADPVVIREGESTVYECNVWGGEEPYVLSTEVGDGSVPSSVEGDDTLTLEHTFPLEGTYTALCTATDAEGEVATDSLDVIVENDAPVCNVVTDVTTGYAPLEVNVVGTTVGGNAPLSYTINAVTPSSSTGYLAEGNITTFTLEDVGMYTVTFMAIDADGDECSDTMVIDVMAVPPQCSDGIDNDGDGHVDMDDIGCETPDDDDETDPLCPYVTCTWEEAPMIARSGDILTLNEQIGDVVETMDSSDAPTGLEQYTLTNRYGTTTVKQYLRFDGFGLTPSTMPDVQVIYTKDDSDEVGDFLRVKDGRPIYRHETEFVEGLDTTVAADGRLPDFEDLTLPMLGQDYVIFNAQQTAMGGVQLEMMAEPLVEILNEDETTTLCHKDRAYEISTSLVGLGETIRLTVNSEVLPEMVEGDQEVLSDGTTVGVRYVTPTGAGYTIDVFLTDRVVRFTDTDPATGTTDGTVEVNEENIEDEEVNLDVTTTPGGLRLNRITTTLYADGVSGDEPHLAPGTGLREHLDEPEGMLSENFDIVYSGFKDVDETEIGFNASGDDEMRLSFVNTQGVEYSNVRLGFCDGDGLRYGDDDNKFIFSQSGDVSDESFFTIGVNDYFMVSHNGDMDTGVTRILSLDSVDEVTELIVMTDVGTGTVTSGRITGPIPDCIDGFAWGDMVASGYAFDFAICVKASGEYGIQMDLDDDGDLGGEATAVALYGGSIDLGDQTDTGEAADPDLAEIVISTDGARIDEAPLGYEENIGIMVSCDRATSMIDASVGLSTDSEFRMYAHEAPEDNVRSGMTTYGALVYQMEEVADPNTVTVLYPETQREPVVEVVFNDCDGGRFE